MSSKKYTSFFVFTHTLQHETTLVYNLYPIELYNIAYRIIPQTANRTSELRLMLVVLDVGAIALVDDERTKNWPHGRTCDVPSTWTSKRKHPKLVGLSGHEWRLSSDWFSISHLRAIHWVVNPQLPMLFLGTLPTELRKCYPYPLHAKIRAHPHKTKLETLNLKKWGKKRLCSVPFHGRHFQVPFSGQCWCHECP